MVQRVSPIVLWACSGAPTFRERYTTMRTVTSSARGSRFASLLLPASVLVLLVACTGRTPVERPEASGLPVTFFALGDPQINIPRWGTAGTERTIELMNRLPGRPFPFGGTVDEPAGVLVAGDLVDDLSNADNWELYKALFDPAGGARLRFPVFDGLGNHDVDVRNQEFGAFNATQLEFIERNGRRAGEFVLDANGYHYAWVWAGVRFVQLNLFPGTQHRPVYDAPAPGNDPKGSLDFLRHVLAHHVGDSDQPLVLTWHYGLRGWGLEKWWLEEDLDQLAAALDGYNVLLILHGHEHRFERYKWRGFDVIMAPSPQYDRDPDQPHLQSRPKGFLVFRITHDSLQMAYRTPTGWADTWSKRIIRPGMRRLATPPPPPASTPVDSSAP
jgi:hypothetical protein